MSLIFADGFDGYGTTNNQNIGSLLATSGYAEVAGQPQLSTNTRTGFGMSVQLTAFNYFGMAIPDQTSVVVGFAMNSEGLGYSTMCQFRYNTFLGNEYVLMSLYRNANGAVTVVIPNRDGSTAYSYHSNPNVLFPNTWQYVECLYTPGASGTITLRVDGVVVIQETSVPTVSQQNPNDVNVIGWYLPSAPDIGMYLDDMIIMSNNGEGMSSMQGDIVVRAILPASDAGPNQMTQQGGGVGHFTTVNDPGVADDTAYVYSDTVGNQEMFGLATFPADILDVLAVGVAVRARKDSAGVADFQIDATVGSNSQNSGSLVTTTVYLTKTMWMESEPGGGSWTVSDAQNMKIGFQTS